MQEHRQQKAHDNAMSREWICNQEWKGVEKLFLRLTLLRQVINRDPKKYDE